ncbi:hypothetical protein BH10BAC2_BH10BAC2_17830 [soil metagenome]
MNKIVVIDDIRFNHILNFKLIILCTAKICCEGVATVIFRE